MQCTKPLTAFKHKFKKSEPMLFQSPKGQAHDYNKLNLPCGQCTFCRLEQSRQWASRIMMEAQLHEQNSFLTLTYSDDNMPEFRSLFREDLTKFFKRLRKSLEPKKIRYYAVGEYGDVTNRPHYHVILFGHDFTDDRKMYKNRKYPLYQSPTLDNAWGLGYANIGNCTFESAAYCARYCLKKVNAPSDEEMEVACDSVTGEVFFAPARIFCDVPPPGYSSQLVEEIRWRYHENGYHLYAGQENETSPLLRQALQAMVPDRFRSHERRKALD